MRFQVIYHEVFFSERTKKRRGGRVCYNGSLIRIIPHALIINQVIIIALKTRQIWLIIANFQSMRKRKVLCSNSLSLSLLYCSLVKGRRRKHNHFHSSKGRNKKQNANKNSAIQLDCNGAYSHAHAHIFGRLLDCPKLVLSGCMYDYTIKRKEKKYKEQKTFTVFTLFCWLTRTDNS